MHRFLAIGEIRNQASSSLNHLRQARLHQKLSGRKPNSPCCWNNKMSRTLHSESFLKREECKVDFVDPGPVEAQPRSKQLRMHTISSQEADFNNALESYTETAPDQK